MRPPFPVELDFAPVIQKPYTRDTIERALARLLGLSDAAAE
ncbi:MAG: hypothetical protein WA851_10975 [Xanthobacteraceae bacterium]